jgi:hypothetical protein
VLVREKVKRQEAYSFVVVLETETGRYFYHNGVVKLRGGGVLDENNEDKRESLVNARHGLYVKYIL